MKTIHEGRIARTARFLAEQTAKEETRLEIVNNF